MSVQDLLLEQLRELYSSETQLLEVLPKLAEGASTRGLRELLEDHVVETRKQVKRLKRIFDNLHESEVGEPCKAMKGLVDESNTQLAKWAGDELGDLAIIASCVRVELFETAAYATTIALARAMGHEGEAELLKETFGEEKRTARNLELVSKPLLLIHSNELENKDGDQS